MKFLIVVLVALCVCAPAFGAWSGGLRVRFELGLNLGTDFFIDMPRSVSEAKTSRWEQVERPDGPMSSLSMYCPGDRIFCVLFDDIEYAAGIQVALPADKFINATFDWATQGFTSWTPANTDGTAGDVTYWTLQQYFVSEEILATDSAERLEAYDTTKVLPYDGVWLTGFNGELTYVSGNADDIKASAFTEQSCIFWMGRHYYYNMSSSTTCSAETIFPWFLLEASGDLIGSAMMLPGVLPAASLEKDYFERPGKSDIELIVPNGPECLYAYGDTPGVLTMHIYYIENPWYLTCILQ